MLQPFFDWIEKFATDFTWRRLAIFLSFLALIGGGLVIYESLTGYFQLAKYEKAIALLEQMQGINKSSSEASKIVENIYAGLLDITTRNNSTTTFEISIGNPLKQMLAASIIWIFLAVFFALRAFRGDSDARRALMAVVVIGLLVGIVGYALPSTMSDWIIFGLYPVGVNLFLIIFISAMGNRTQ